MQQPQQPQQQLGDAPAPMENRMLTANWLSYLSWFWVGQLLSLGRKRPLQLPDLDPLCPHDRAEFQFRRIARSCPDHSVRGIWIALFRAFGPAFLGTGFLLIAYIACQLAQPLFLRELVRFIERDGRSDGGEDAREGYMWACLLGTAVVMQGVLHHQYFFHSMRTGMNVRVALTGLVYRKALDLNAVAFSATTTGQIVNLVSNDVYKFEEGFPFFHYCYAGFLVAIVAVYLMWQDIGVASLAGLGTLLLLVPVQKVFAGRFAKQRRRTMLQTDRRVKTMNEILVAADTVKMYCWEEPFEKRVTSIRHDEFKSIMVASVLRALNQAIFFVSAPVVSFVTFSTYSSLGHTLDAGAVFSVVALFGVIRLPLTLFISMGIEKLSESRVSVRRISAFLRLAEAPRNAALSYTQASSSPTPPNSGDSAVLEMQNASFQWELPQQADDLSALATTELSKSAPVPLPFAVRDAKTQAARTDADMLRRDLVELQRLVNSLPKPENGASPSQSAQQEEDEVERRISALYARIRGSLHQSRQLALSQGQSDGLQADLRQISTALRVPRSHARGRSRISESGFDAGGRGGVTLRDISLSVRDGELLAVVGPIGAGKSSLLAAVVGEIQLISGSCHVRRSASSSSDVHVGGDTGGAGAFSDDVSASLALAPQKSWIFAGTVRENILFGRPFEKEHYWATVHACQLEVDLEQLPSGDQTIIGERGVNLSGGQKARVSLARAVYARDAQLFLLDDPLSAVDAVVARKLFDRVIGPKGLLSGKTRILVTHATHLLPKCDRVLLLADGRVRFLGHPSALPQATLESLVGHHADQSRAFRNSRQSSEGTDAKDELPQSTDEVEGGLAAKKKGKAAGIIVEEDRVQGTVHWSLYAELFRAAGGLSMGLAVILMMTIGQAAYILVDWWLSVWAGTNSEEQDDDQSYYIGVYGGLVGLAVLSGVVRSLFTFRALLRGSNNFHLKMVSGVMYASIRFFEANPVGRVLNRFSKDQAILDELMPVTFYDTLQATLLVIGSLIVVAAVNPLMLPVIAVVCVPFFWARKHYLTSTREIKRLDGTTRSPIYAHFSATLSGIVTIRAFSRQRQMFQTFLAHIDDNTRSLFAWLAAARWLGFRLDMITSTVVFATGLLAMVMRDNLSASAVGLSLSYSLFLTGLLQWATRQSAELENQMTAAERVLAYAKLPPEGDRIIPDHRPPPGWPKNGEVEFSNVVARYREGLEPVLHHVSVKIAPQEKIGVAGRTGSGKTTFLATLFRLVDIVEGTVVIDGVDAKSIGLADLRSQLSIIPQNPVLFSGSVRYNLDPFQQHTDEELWAVLDSVGLATRARLPGGLDSRVAEFGGNFSVGEAQLLCIARAILHRAKVLLVDEATASVDNATDKLVQSVIRSKFRDRTVITIAHRLHTIMDSDRVLVLDGGRVVEFDTPQRLLQRPNGIFATMARRMHIGSSGDMMDGAEMEKQ